MKKTVKTETCVNVRSWPKKVRYGRHTVAVYRRFVGGVPYFWVADYSSGRRQLRSFKTEAEAIQTAEDLARRMSTRQVLAAGLTNRQAVEYVSAVEMLEPYGVPLLLGVETLVEGLKLVGDCQIIRWACEEYVENHRAVTPKPVAEAVKELIEIKQARGASPRYIADLRYRLGKLARSIIKNLGDVSVRDIQSWLDAEGGAPQTYANNRRVACLLFEFGQTRGYCRNNPALACESVKVGAPAVDFYSVSEMRQILNAAGPDVLPVIVLGGFCGLRSAEIERLEWHDIDLQSGTVTVDADKSKCATRRVVPMPANARAWLLPYAGKTGRVWRGASWQMYRAVSETIKRAGIKPRPNGFRHSYASYRFALTNDAGKVAGELGNSPQILHKHYRNLVRPDDGRAYFELMPPGQANVVPLAAGNQ